MNTVHSLQCVYNLDSVASTGRMAVLRIVVYYLGWLAPGGTVAVRGAGDSIVTCPRIGTTTPLGRSGGGATIRAVRPTASHEICASTTVFILIHQTSLCGRNCVQTIKINKQTITLIRSSKIKIP